MSHVDRRGEGLSASGLPETHNPPTTPERPCGAQCVHLRHGCPEPCSSFLRDPQGSPQEIQMGEQEAGGLSSRSDLSSQAHQPHRSLLIP